MGRHYDVDVFTPFREQLPVAEGWAMKRAIDGEFTHLLHIEDDHWGFRLQSFEDLLRANRPLVGCYSMQRRQPMHSSLGHKKDPDVPLMGESHKTNIIWMEKVPGEALVKDVDITGVGFTLIETELLKALPDNPFQGMQTDAKLCQAALDLGVQPAGHFGVKTNHDVVTFANRFLINQIQQLERHKDEGGDPTAGDEWEDIRWNFRDDQSGGRPRSGGSHDGAGARASA